ncbi:MAG: Holliday junction resolvase RuvX [Myxococcales bacterium]|nr:Holliday junction resolvase RuvX [Myxococcales bacterium]|tara:strand:+ start:422 stop:844 length:423 start_codon:yes stop_codon:yes gene_type:complete
MRVLGIDHGTKRIGLALSDPFGVIASPFGFFDTHPRTRLKKRLEKLFLEQDVRVVVVGEPLMMDGSVGVQAEKVDDFVVWLESWCTVRIERVDERLTSVMAEKALIEGGVRRAERKQKRDAIAAAILLQSWLDAQVKDEG